MMHRETIDMDEGGETDKSADGRISAGCAIGMHFSKIVTSDRSLEFVAPFISQVYFF